MSKSRKASVLDFLQNTAIVLLSASFLFLLTQTPLFGDVSGKSLPELFRPSDEESGHGHTSSLQSGSVLPLQMMLTGEQARCGFSSLTTADPVFTQNCDPLYEALRSAKGERPVDAQAFSDAMNVAGMYFDFLSDLPFDTLTGRLNGTQSPDGSLSVRRLMLVPDRTKSAMLYVQNSAGEAFRFDTAVRSDDLFDALSAVVPNGADFAMNFKFGASLSPYGILDTAVPAYPRIAGASFLPEQEQLLRLVGFNPHTENYYTDAAGTLVVREGASTLSIAVDGTLLYQGGTAEEGSPFYVESATALTLAGRIGAAQSLTFSFLDGRTGDALLYCSSATEKDGATTVCFDAQIAGTPLRFSDGTHMAEVTIRGQSIVSLALHFRTYTESDAEVKLLPAPQAAAIASARGDGAIRVVYMDHMSDTVLPVWIAEAP